MLIDRCLCLGVTFRQLKEQADRTAHTRLEDLQVVMPFGTGCGLCKPYVREMLRTGVTEFDRIITDSGDA